MTKGSREIRQQGSKGARRDQQQLRAQDLRSELIFVYSVFTRRIILSNLFCPFDISLFRPLSPSIHSFRLAFLSRAAARFSPSLQRLLVWKWLTKMLEPRESFSYVMVKSVLF